MNDSRKQKLIDLGSDALADALLNLAVHCDEADDLIEQLIATPKENVQRFKKKPSGLKHSRRFIDWRGATGFARELKMLLQDLKSGGDYDSEQFDSGSIKWELMKYLCWSRDRQVSKLGRR